jgi:hypothetical protein
MDRGQGKVAIGRAAGCDLLALELDAIDQAPVDLIEVLASQVRVEPAKPCLVILVRGLVLRFQEPANDRLFPGMSSLQS